MVYVKAFPFPEQLAEAVLPILKPYGDALFSTFSPAYQFLDVNSKKIGMEADIFTFVLLLLSSLPLAFIHRHILPNSPTLKHLYSASIGLFFAFFSYGYASLITLSTVIVCYLMMLLLPRTMSHKAVLLFTFALISYIHIYRMISEYISTRIDFSGMQMMLTGRLMICAMNYRDGARKPDEMHPSRANCAVKRIPNPLEFLGFSFFYPAVLAGPVFDMQHYLQFQRQYGLPKLPTCYLQILKRVLLVAFSVYVFVNGIPYFSRDYMWDGRYYEFDFFKRLWFPVIMVIMFTSRYHMVWYLAEAALILAGMGYNGTDEKGNAKWDKVLQTDMIRFELAPNPQQLASTWNISIHRAFKTYIYHSGTKGSKPGGLNIGAVYLASAVWHGFYPGYYIFFGLLGFGTFFSRLYQRNFGPLCYVQNAKKWTDLTLLHIVCNLISWLVMHTFTYWAATSFLLLSLDDTLNFWKSIYYIPIIVIVFCTLLGKFFDIILPKMFKSVAEARRKENEGYKPRPKKD